MDKAEILKHAKSQISKHVDKITYTHGNSSVQNKEVHCYHLRTPDYSILAYDYRKVTIKDKNNNTYSYSDQTAKFLFDEIKNAYEQYLNKIGKCPNIRNSKFIRYQSTYIHKAENYAR